MNKEAKTKRLKELREKLVKYEKKLADKSLGYGDVVRTRYGDSYEDQLRDDTNALRAFIVSIKEEIKSLEK